MSELRRYQQYIDGQWVDAVSGAVFESENPMAGASWAVVPRSDERDIDLAVQAARRAFDSGPWKTMRAQERAACLRRLAALIEQHGQEIAEFEARDNGKVLGEQRFQWWMMGEIMHSWAGVPDKIEGRVLQGALPFPTEGSPFPNAFAYTRREPVGVVGAITPWNSPGFQLMFKFGPAMAAGCTMVVKPSEHAPVSTLEFAKLVDQAGFPAGVFNVVTSDDREVGAALARHSGLDKVSFTGSTATGKKVLHAAAENVARVTVELGGKSASIIFNDADLTKAVTGIIAGVFAAAGQSCMASSRVFVQRDLHDTFVAALVSVVSTLKLGDPMEHDTVIGPISNRPNFEKVMRYLDIGRSEGATVACGGGQPAGLGGYFVEPTVFTGVTPSMRIATEEIFGPVVCVMPFDTEDEAIALANDSEFGLGGAVFTTDLPRAHRVAHQIRTGTVWINTYRMVTQLAPFGGYKSSGMGREGSVEAMDAYLETKTVWVPTS
jgi:acyl-CoA reductase-like NAD-dependent aldehyde dehydrogenase